MPIPCLRRPQGGGERTRERQDRIRGKFTLSGIYISSLRGHFNYKYMAIPYARRILSGSLLLLLERDREGRVFSD